MQEKLSKKGKRAAVFLSMMSSKKVKKYQNISATFTIGTAEKTIALSVYSLHKKAIRLMYLSH